MTPLEKAARALDEYAAHTAEDGIVGTIPVPVRLLQALRRALKDGSR